MKSLKYNYDENTVHVICNCIHYSVSTKKAGVADVITFSIQLGFNLHIQSKLL